VDPYCKGSVTGNPWQFNSKLGVDMCEPHRVCSEYTTARMIATGGAESGLGDTCTDGSIPDWCQANDHPHFDLDASLINYFCGSSLSSFCQFDSMQPIECTWDGFGQVTPVIPSRNSAAPAKREPEKHPAVKPKLPIGYVLAPILLAVTVLALAAVFVVVHRRRQPHPEAMYVAMTSPLNPAPSAEFH
jgi:hypothetical protein